MTEPGRRPGAAGARAAAVVLLAVPPVAALAVLAACLPAVVLVPFGLWRPAVVVPVLLLAVGAVLWLGRWAGLTRVPATGRPVPAWTAVACVLVAVGFGVWAGVTHGEHLVLRRDAGSYALYAHWLATRHGLPVSADLSSFGGPPALDVPGFTLDSPAYYQVLTGSGAGAGARIDPQFLLGAPALFSTGWWLAGWTGLLTAPAVLGALAVLAAGSVAARVAGPRWAPLAAAGLALTQPVVHAARATYSEPVAMLLVLGCAALAVDALDTGPGTGRDAGPGTGRGPARARRVAVLAGAMLGLAGLVRIDAVREVALLLPVCAVLWARRHPAALPLAGSALGGIAVSFVPAVALARPYLHTVQGSLRPVLAGTAALVVACPVAVAVHRRWEARRAGRPPSAAARRLLPPAAAGLVVLAGAVLASRPLWTTARQAAGDPGNALVASLQAQQHLPVDGARTYDERSVEWVLWYVGVPAAVLALLALAGAAAAGARWWLASGRAAGAGTGTDGVPDGGPDGAPPPPRWLVPAAVGLGSAVLTLYRPGITPDHPWADRRLVPVVLPLVAVAAVAAAARLTRWVATAARPAAVPGRDRRGLVAAVVVAAVAAVLVPAYEGTKGLATVRTEVGEPAAVADVCAALRPGDVVVTVGDARGGVRAQDEWVQVVRGVCGHPSGALRPDRGGPVDVRASAARLDALVRGAGGRLVLLSAGEDDGSARGALTDLGLAPARAVLHRTTEDQHLLTRRPSDRRGLVIDVWLAVWR